MRDKSDSARSFTTNTDSQQSQCSNSGVAGITTTQQTSRHEMTAHVFSNGTYTSMKAHELRALDERIRFAADAAKAQLSNLNNRRREALLWNDADAASADIDALDAQILTASRIIEQCGHRRDELTKQHRPSARHPNKHWRDRSED
jgi:Zn-finger domain-containing protein